VFVTGAGTDVGKTYVACALIRALRAQGLTVDALKPVASGFDPGRMAEGDPGRLLVALGRPLTTDALDAISPLRFAAPLAPPSAARREGRTLTFEAVLEPCRARMARADVDVLLIEGAGGVMSPIAEGATNLDLIEALGVPLVLVGGSYLGAMSHSLTALETLKAHGCKSLALVVSESPDGIDLAETVAELSRFAGGVPVVALPRFGEIDPRSAGDMLQFPDKVR
jgi:dethiobiotin synthetase